MTMRFPRIQISKMGRAGFTLVEVVVAIGILTILIGILMPAIQAARQAAARNACQNNLRQLGLGLHSYHAVHGSLPSGADIRLGPNPYPFMSWHVRILPYIDQSPLWTQALAAYAQNPDPTFNPPHSGLATAVRLFICPADSRARYVRAVTDPRTANIALTAYLGVSGTDSVMCDGVLFNQSHIALSDVRDGTSNTAMIGERPPSNLRPMGSWYRGYGQGGEGSADVVLGTREVNVILPACPSSGYQFTPGRASSLCDLFHFWSMHPGGSSFVLADGSVQFLRYSADTVLPALGSRAGGESVQMPE